MLGIRGGSTNSTSYIRGMSICGFEDTGAPGTHPLRILRDSCISFQALVPGPFLQHFQDKLHPVGGIQRKLFIDFHVEWEARPVVQAVKEFTKGAKGRGN